MPHLHLASDLVFLLAGLFKGLIGLGLPIIAMGLLTLFMSPAEAAKLLVVPAFFTNVQQAFSGGHLVALVARLWSMLAALVAGALATGTAILGAAQTMALAALGLALLAYAAVAWRAVAWNIPRRIEPWLGPVVGLATGAVTASTGVFSIPSGPYLQALGLDKDALVQALGLVFLVSTLTLAANVAPSMVLDTAYLSEAGEAVMAAFLGMAIGQRLRMFVDAELFRRIFLVSLSAIGASLVWRSATSFFAP